MAPAEPRPAADEDDPRRWLGCSPLFDLEEPKLRLRVRALTQLSKTERDKALAVYRFVKRLPLSRPFKLRLRTAGEVLKSGRGDAPDKATLLVAMLRVAGVPARIRYLSLHGGILRGLVPGLRHAMRPLVEMWLDGRWCRTDTFIFDAAFMAAARQRLKDRGWQWGYGIAVDGAMLWDGTRDAFVGGCPPEEDRMVLGQLGVFHDPADCMARAYGERYRRFLRLVQWTLVAPLMQRTIRRLREDFAPSTNTLARRRS